MGIMEDGIKAMENHVFVLDQFDTYPNIDIEGIYSNPQSTVAYVINLDRGLKNNKTLP
jgi:hypothetical protein